MCPATFLGSESSSIGNQSPSAQGRGIWSCSRIGPSCKTCIVRAVFEPMNLEAYYRSVRCSCHVSPCTASVRRIYPPRTPLVAHNVEPSAANGSRCFQEPWFSRLSWKSCGHLSLRCRKNAGFLPMNREICWPYICLGRRNGRELPWRPGALRT